MELTLFKTTNLLKKLFGFRIMAGSVVLMLAHFPLTAS